MGKKDGGSEGAFSAVTELVRVLPVEEVRPAAREVARALETVAKAVNAALAPLSALVWGFEKLRTFVQERVASKLVGVPEERIVTPNLQVAGPVLDAVRYCGHQETLAELYANLLASSLDSATALSAHPSFVDIVKNMTPDEAKIMRLLSDGESWPIVDVLIQMPHSGFAVGLRNFCFLADRAACDHPALLASYLDNLSRLGLIEMPSATKLMQGRYERLERSPQILQLRGQLTAGQKLRFQRKLVRITAFGEQFCVACMRRRSS